MFSTISFAPASKMTSLSIKPSELQRNRENQRRSRARRKEHTAELEKRLERLQRDGIQATEVVQRAARRVVEENKFLRQLLLLNGVRSSSVDEYLESKGFLVTGTQQTLQVGSLAPVGRTPTETSVQHRKYGDSDTSRVPLRNGQVDASSRGAARLQASRDPYSRAQILPLERNSRARVRPLSKHSEQQTSGPELLCATSRARDHDRSIYGGSEHDGTSFSVDEHTATGISEPDQSEEPQRPVQYTQIAKDETDCENAARIITSMRGRGRPEDVWAELGCSTRTRTAVKNALILTLAD